MGTSTAKTAQETPTVPVVNASKEPESLDEVKMEIHQRAKEIISSFPQKVFLLRRICNLHSFYETSLAEYTEYSFDRSQFDSSVIADVASEIEKRPLKRKREDSDHYGFSLSLSRMKHILAIERDAFISDIDDLTISLNLHELETSTKSCICHPQSIESQSIGARQGLMSLISNHRSTVLNDVEDIKNQNHNGAKQLKAMKCVIDTFNANPVNLTFNEVAKRLDVILDDYRASLKENSFAEEILVKAHLRRLRNLYIVLMEVCNRDEKLLAW